MFVLKQTIAPCANTLYKPLHPTKRKICSMIVPRILFIWYYIKYSWNKHQQNAKQHWMRGEMKKKHRWKEEMKTVPQRFITWEAHARCRKNEFGKQSVGHRFRLLVDVFSLRKKNRSRLLFEYDKIIVHS